MKRLASVRVSTLRPLLDRRFVHNWFLAALLVLALLAILPATAHAKYAALVIDADTGKVLHESNADTRNYPASLTKMMTLYLMFEAIDQGRMKLNDPITMTRHAAGQPPSKLGVAVGDRFSVETAIRALAIKSANDVAAAVAEHMAGSEAQFALLMTAKARGLGMTQTTFRNASGLPHKAQMTTARDMANLARALLKHYPHHYHYFSEEAFAFDGSKHKTHNALLTNYEGTDGIKTGYIRASGFNLVASVKRGDKRLIGVVFGANSAPKRNAQMVSLLEQGWQKIAPQLANRPVSKTSPAKVAAETPPAPSSIPSRAQQRAPQTVTVADGDVVWGVQVGAFKDQEPAYEIATRAISVASQYLADGDIVVSPLRKKNGRVLYRGTVVNISKTQAYRACRVLEQRNMGCLPLKVTTPLEVASLD